MAWRIFRTLYGFAFPGGVLVLGLWLLVDRWESAQAVAQLARIWPWAVLLAAAVLAFWFHQLRVLEAALLFGLAERGLAFVAEAGPTSVGPHLEALVVGLVALNLLWIQFVRPRARLSWRSGGLVVALLVQGILVAVLLSSAAVQAQEWLIRLAGPFLSGRAALGLLLVPMALLALRALRHRSASERGLAWATMAVALAAWTEGAGPRAVYFTGCGIILVLTVLEGSYQMAYEDELTGLPSRRALNEALADLGEEYAIAVVDVDHFKQVNDRHGHEVGDQVLQAVAARLRRVGGGGRAFRYGGEEFALLFAGKRVPQVVSDLEALREEIAGARFTLRNPGRPRRQSKRAAARRGRRKGKQRSIGVTVSIGVAHPSRARPNATSVLKAADQALYRAKRGGRNQLRK